MSKQRSKELPAGIERVRSQFKSWRAQKHKGERIPEPVTV